MKISLQDKAIVIAELFKRAQQFVGAVDSTASWLESELEDNNFEETITLTLYENGIEEAPTLEVEYNHLTKTYILEDFDEDRSEDDDYEDDED